MYWIGAPVGVIGFWRGVELNQEVWLAPIVSMTAVGLGGSLANLWIRIWERFDRIRWLRQRSLGSEDSQDTQDLEVVENSQDLQDLQNLEIAEKSIELRDLAEKPKELQDLADLKDREEQEKLKDRGTQWRSPNWSDAQRGSFHLTSMLGNTGYLGFPICLAVGGPTYFAWALFYDMLGNVFSVYGFGVWVASRFSRSEVSQLQLLANVIRSPTLWAFGVGVTLSQQPLPFWIDLSLRRFAWTMIPLSLILLGMRLAQVSQWRSFGYAAIALVIKIIIVPVVVGLGLSLTSLPALPRLMITLQAGMPPAIATLVLAEEYNLDREITVAALAVGYVAALLTLPIWVALWG